mgnify:CR=1 FL=1
MPYMHPPTSWDEVTSHWAHAYGKGYWVHVKVQQKPSWLPSRIEKVIVYMIKIQKEPSWLPRIAWKPSKEIHKAVKSIILCSRWMQDMKKWRGWAATHLLHNASNDSSLNKTFLQHQCIMKWEKWWRLMPHIILHMLGNYIFYQTRKSHTNTC